MRIAVRDRGLWYGKGCGREVAWCGLYGRPAVLAALRWMPHAECRRAVRPGGIQRVASSATLREQLGARIDRTMRLRDRNLFRTTGRGHARQCAYRRQRHDLHQPAHRTEIIM